MNHGEAGSFETEGVTIGFLAEPGGFYMKRGTETDRHSGSCSLWMKTEQKTSGLICFRQRERFPCRKQTAAQLSE